MLALLVKIIGPIKKTPVTFLVDQPTLRICFLEHFESKTCATNCYRLNSISSSIHLESPTFNVSLFVDRSFRGQLNIKVIIKMGPYFRRTGLFRRRKIRAMCTETRSPEDRGRVIMSAKSGLRRIQTQGTLMLDFQPSGL